MKIGPGVSELWEVENRHIPLTRPVAYTTACTTVQAVICVGTREFLVTPLLMGPVYVLSEDRREEPVRPCRHSFSILRAFSAGAVLRENARMGPVA